MEKNIVLEIGNVLEVWTVKDLLETTDHLGEIVIEILEREGLEIPEGCFNSRFNSKVIGVGRDLESSKITLEEGVSSIVKIILDSKNYN